MADKKTDHHGLSDKAKEANIKKMGQTEGKFYGQNSNVKKGNKG